MFNKKLKEIQRKMQEEIDGYKQQLEGTERRMRYWTDMFEKYQTLSGRLAKELGETSKQLEETKSQLELLKKAIDKDRLIKLIEQS